MGLEIATYVNGLVETNPPNGDPMAQGDDHIRLLKAVLKASFPLVNGALNATMVPYTAAGNLVATNVGAAIDELDSEKAAKGVFTNGQFTFGATTKLLGRSTAGAGAGEEIGIGTGLTLSGGILACSVTGGVTTFNTRSGAVTLSGADVTTALGYTPLSAAPVTSVGGYTGAVSAAQVGAAALAGGAAAAGHTHSGYLATDANSTIGAIVYCGNCSNNRVVGTAYTASTYGGFPIVQLGGTWRTLAFGVLTHDEGGNPNAWWCLAQRIS